MYGILDYYTILGLSPDALSNEIKQSFRRLAQLHHPDKNNSTSDSQLLFRSILEAYKVLSSEEGRLRYDNYLRTSTVLSRKVEKKPKSPDPPINTNIEQIVSDVKSQLNFILWEIEDLLKTIKIQGQSQKLGEQTIEEVIIYTLTFFDKWILNPAGFGDYFYTARQIDVGMTYNPFDIDVNHAHRPYVDSEDYFFQLRRRFDKFMNKLQKSDLSKTVTGTDFTLFDCIFEAVNLSFHNLGFINLKINKEELQYHRFVFSNRAFDNNEVKYLKWG